MLKSPVIMNSCEVVAAEEIYLERHCLVESIWMMTAAIDVKNGECRGRRFKCDR